MEADGVYPSTLFARIAEVSTTLSRAVQAKQRATITVSTIGGDDKRRARGNSFQIAGSCTLH